MNPGSHLRDVPCANASSFFDFPGGPGVSGVDWFSDGGPVFQSIVGSDWDVLSFDPREFHPQPTPKPTFLTYPRTSRAMQAVSVFPVQYSSSLLLQMRRPPSGKVS